MGTAIEGRSPAGELLERSHRLGADPRNTNFAGGNTSAKGVETDPATGEPVELKAMSAFERKVVHDAVAAAGATSVSKGEEPNRRIVVQPA